MASPSRSAIDADLWSEKRQRLLELLPAGWILVDHRPVEVDTPVGYLVRRQAVFVRCSRCRRRTPLDLEDLARSPLARQPVSAAVEALKCGHWRGCGLALQPATYPAGAPLVTLLTHPGMEIEIGCRYCDQVAFRTPEQVIRALIAARMGDGGTGMDELGDLIRGPCRKCGATRFYAVFHSGGVHGAPGGRGHTWRPR